MDSSTSNFEIGQHVRTKRYNKKGVIKNRLVSDDIYFVEFAEGDGLWYRRRDIELDSTDKKRDLPTEIDLNTARIYVMSMIQFSGLPDEVERLGRLVLKKLDELGEKIGS